MRREPQRAPIGREVVGQSGGRRVAKRTLSRKDGTAWPEAGMRSRESSERLRLRLQEIIPALVLAPAPSLTSRRLRLQLRFRENCSAPVAPAPYAWILGIFSMAPAPTPTLLRLNISAAPGKMFRLGRSRLGRPGYFGQPGGC